MYITSRVHAYLKFGTVHSFRKADFTNQLKVLQRIYDLRERERGEEERKGLIFEKIKLTGGFISGVRCDEERDDGARTVFKIKNTKYIY